jgi:asparagine synthase (glutamine-hydrolysing)
VSFSGEFETERTYAQKIANEYNTDHHEFFFNESDLEEIPKMVWHLDEPVGDAATLPTMVLSRYVKKYVTVVLAGEGGDETFAGYENQRIMTKCMIFDNAPKPVKQVVSFLNQFTSIDSNTHRLLNTISSVNIPHQYLSLISLFSKEELKKIGLCSIDNDVEPDIGGGLIKKIAIINDSPCDIHLPHTTDLFPNLSQLFPQTMKPLNQLLYFGFKTWLPNDFCLKADKMTMAYGIEERSPFLDCKLVNFAFTLQPSYKIQGNVGKYLLKRAMHSLLPQEIVDRKKHGFDVPMDGWFKGPLKSVLEDLLEERSHDLYDKEYIKFLLHKFQRSGNNYSLNFFNAQKLWSILVFEIWYRIFIEKIDYGKICL